MNLMLKLSVIIFLLVATLVIASLVVGTVQAQTIHLGQYTYTVPMLQDTVVVITSSNAHSNEIVYTFFTEMGWPVEWQSGSMYLHPHVTVAKWYCLPIGDTPWFSLNLTSELPLSIKTYLDKEIAQGYGCP